MKKREPKEEQKPVHDRRQEYLSSAVEMPRAPGEKKRAAPPKGVPRLLA